MSAIASIHPMPALRQRPSVAELLAPLEKLARGSDRLFSAPIQIADPGLGTRTLPRFLFVGPESGGDYMRVGLFGAIHGDEVAGAHAIVELLGRFHEEPDLARGYEIFAYPVCNPHGYEFATRWSRSGRDLNREFWSDSPEPEVRAIESNLSKLGFQGLVALHADDTSEGLYGFVKGHQLTRYVLEPALRRAENILPRNYDKSIDNFRANEGIIEQGYDGILSAPPNSGPRPFEIVFETPQLAPIDRQTEAGVVAVIEILARFREIISEAQNI